MNGSVRRRGRSARFKRGKEISLARKFKEEKSVGYYTTGCAGGRHPGARSAPDFSRRCFAPQRGQNKSRLPSGKLHS
jgi:hypothetical protein